MKNVSECEIASKFVGVGSRQVKYRLVKSGGVYELSEYEKPIQIGIEYRYRDFSCFKRGRGVISIVDKKVARADNLKRARRVVRRLADCNEKMNTMITLTYVKCKDVATGHKAFGDWVARVEYQYNIDLQYVATVEFQKDYDFFGKKKEGGGDVHYHVLCNYPRVEKMSDVDEVWGHGSTKKQNVWNRRKVIYYITKYFVKDMSDERLFRRKKYLRSRNLLEPEIFENDDALAEVEKIFSDSRYSLESSNLMETKWLGQIKFKMYVENKSKAGIPCRAMPAMSSTENGDLGWKVPIGRVQEV